MKEGVQIVYSQYTS